MNKVFLGMIAILLFAASTLAAQPKLEIVGGNTYDWGEVNENDNKLKGQFTLKNAGSDTLIIKNVKPTCGCTTAPLKKDELAPGEETTIDVELRLGKRGGPVTKTIKIHTNDATNPHQIYYLKAKVFQPLELKPKKYLVFNNLQVGTPGETTVELHNNTDKPVMIKSFKVSPKDLIVNLKENTTVPPGKYVKIVANATPQKKGYFNCSIILETDHPDYPKYTINGYGPVKASPVFNDNE